MHPILIDVAVGSASITLRSYLAFLVLAALVAGGLAGRVLVRMGVGRRSAIGGLAAAVLAGLVWARLLAVILAPSRYAADPASAFVLEPSEFALYGGLAGSGAVLLWLARHWHLDTARLADRLVVPIATGLVLLRIGCFLNGCCAGIATGLPWGVVFPPGSAAWGQQVIGGNAGALFGRVSPVHPTQLYEATAAIALAAVALRLGRRGEPDGVPALLFATGFLAFRAFNQTLRVPSLDQLLPEPVLVEAYALGALAFGVGLLGRVALRRQDSPLGAGLP
ncbi:MAG: prolipoprotein diacylglyceryl transferase [Candidatus Limnocylindrales bacterium]|nr:prolipoprotein diacylglyceryl transferase [Candidatus Limnocylindrales bacterium]